MCIDPMFQTLVIPIAAGALWAVVYLIGRLFGFFGDENG